MCIEEILQLFKSNKFGNDIHSKVEYIMTKTYEYTQEELLFMYDNGLEAYEREWC